MGTTLLILCSAIFALSLLGPVLLFCLYPLFLTLSWAFHRRTPPPHKERESLPSVSIIVVARNAEELIGSKLENDVALDYPKERYEIIVYSDGSDDATEQIVREFDDDRVSLLRSDKHRGKAHGMNESVQEAAGEVIVFSDADALLRQDALRRIIRRYDDSDVGGVCGHRQVGEMAEGTARAQMFYIGFDSMIKRLESAIGSITSNDGKLHSMRAELYQPVLEGGSDDLDCCLDVVAQNRRYVFEPEARAIVPVPSKSVHQEIMRRRRIVCGSLKTIFSHCELFNPLQYGLYGARLGINKVLRRFLPLSLVFLFVTSLALAPYHAVFQGLAVLQTLFYLTAGSYPLLRAHLATGSLVEELLETAFYFCVGNGGTLLGVWDYFRGRDYTTWKPSRREATHT